MMVLTAGFIISLAVNQINEQLSLKRWIVRVFGQCFTVGFRETIQTLFALTGLWMIGGTFLFILFVPLTVLGACLSMMGIIIFQLLMFGERETKSKFDLHQATIQSEPQKIQTLRNKRFQSLGITVFLYLITIAALRDMDVIGVETYRPLLVVSLFVLLPMWQRLILSFFIGRLIWEPYVDDGIRIRTMIVWLSPVFLPILYLFCIAIYAYPRINDIHVLGASIIVLVVSLAIIQSIAVICFMYYGSSAYSQKQSALREQKIEILRMISDIALKQSKSGLDKNRINLSCVILKELRTYATENVILRYVFGEYYIARAKKMKFIGPIFHEVGRSLFFIDEASSKSNFAEYAKLDHERPVPIEVEQLQADILIPFNQSLNIRASKIKPILDKNLAKLRGWDLRFWYCLDLIDYVLLLLDEDVDVSRINELRSLDVNIMSPPKFMGKAMATFLFGSLSAIIGHYGFNIEGLREIVAPFLQ